MVKVKLRSAVDGKSIGVYADDFPTFSDSVKKHYGQGSLFVGEDLIATNTFNLEEGQEFTWQPSVQGQQRASTHAEGGGGGGEVNGVDVQLEVGGKKIMVFASTTPTSQGRKLDLRREIEDKYKVEVQRIKIMDHPVDGDCKPDYSPLDNYNPTIKAGQKVYVKAKKTGNRQGWAVALRFAGWSAWTLVLAQLHKPVGLPFSLAKNAYCTMVDIARLIGIVQRYKQRQRQERQQQQPESLAPSSCTYYLAGRGAGRAVPLMVVMRPAGLASARVDPGKLLPPAVAAAAASLHASGSMGQGAEGREAVPPAPVPPALVGASV